MATRGLPALSISAPRVPPQGYGLYSAATLVDDPAPARLDGGVDLGATNSGPSGTWVTGCTPAEDDDVKSGGGQCEDYAHFPPITVWGADERRLVGVTGEDADTAARHILDIVEPLEVEKHVADRLKTEVASTTEEAVGQHGWSFIRAVGAIESYLGEQGIPGVIHAPRSAAAIAASEGLLITSGGRATTPLGTRWAFGGGYTSLEGLLVGTGPIVIHRGPITVTTGHDLKDNRRHVIAERVVAPAWEGYATAAQYNQEA